MTAPSDLTQRAPARFHEISVPTTDVRASIDFYQALGFTTVDTSDVLPHRYGVITDGHLVLGLHETPTLTPGITFVRPALAAWACELNAPGSALEPLLSRTHPETFNEIIFEDPQGHRLWFIEAPIHAAVNPRCSASACGDFLHLSLPARHPQALCDFWEPFGFVALGEASEPYDHHSLTRDHLNLALHSPRRLDAPLLVFVNADPARVQALQDTGIPTGRLPRGLPPEHATLFESPEGTALLVVNV